MNLKSIILPSFFSLFFLLGFVHESIGQNASEIEKKTREFVAYELQQQDLVKAKTSNVRL